MQIVDRLGKEHCRVFPLAPGATRVRHQEDLVHADVKRVAPEGFDQLVDQGEDDLVDIRVKRAPAPAIDPGIVLGDLGRLVELGMLGQ